MSAQRLGSMTDALLISRKCFLNVQLFELFERFSEQDVTIKHRIDYSLELRFYLHFSLNFVL